MAPRDSVGAERNTVGRAHTTMVVELVLTLLLALALALATAGLTQARRPRAHEASKGTVSVVYAGSLENLMENAFGPSFQNATGYAFRGYGGGSTEDASEIKGGVRVADVFVSASAAADKALEGAANGSWVSWYSTFAASQLVLGYDPHTSFGRELAHGKPWYQVLTQSGVLVGRTDPMLDPKGVLTVEAIDNAAAKLHDPALARSLESFSTYPETALVGRLQSGQLDAGFFYAAEAAAAHIPTVSLRPAYKYALYTVAIVNRDPDPSAATAFVKYMLSAKGARVLKREGLQATPPKFSGDRAAVPHSLRAAVGAR